MAYKICKCGKQLGVRTLKCECGNVFESAKKSAKATKEVTEPKRKRRKKRKNMLLKVDWKTLKPDDLIKVAGGPYFPKANERISMGYNGIFKVYKLDVNGIVALPVKANESGFCFIRMNRTTSSVTGCVHVPHSIRLINNETQTKTA